MTSELLPRDLDGTYRLLAKLGQGGMGVVYRGVATALDRPVAVKMLRKDVSAPLAERFLNEARLSAQIESAHCVDVLHFGTSGEGEPFLVMEYLRGLTLQQVFRREGRLSPERTVHIGVQLCRALAAAHDLGVVHRDLKPANIMLVQRDGVDDFVKVLDFGIAKLLQATAPRLTDEGMVVGTLHSIAPEQVQGLPIDGRADMYATGALLYRCLTGERVFDADDPATFADLHVSAAPVPPTQRCPDLHIPPALEVAILRCLQKDPDHRYRDMRELADALLDVFAEAGGGMATRVIARHLGLTPSTSEGGSTPVPVATAAPPIAEEPEEDRLGTLVMGTPDFGPMELPGDPTEESPAHPRPASSLPAGEEIDTQPALLPEPIAFAADPDPTDETPLPAEAIAYAQPTLRQAPRSSGTGWLVAGIFLGVLVALGGTGYIVATHGAEAGGLALAEKLADEASSAGVSGFDFGLKPEALELALADTLNDDDGIPDDGATAPAAAAPQEKIASESKRKKEPARAAFRLTSSGDQPKKKSATKPVAKPRKAAATAGTSKSKSKAQTASRDPRATKRERRIETARAAKSDDASQAKRDKAARVEQARAAQAAKKADDAKPAKPAKRKKRASDSEWTASGAPPPPL